jgi:GSH-dependent disulfide-bond oxidoreductase
MAMILPQRSVFYLMCDRQGTKKGLPGRMASARGGAMQHSRSDAKREEQTMITLYGMGSPNVVKVYIALEELTLAYTVQPVDVFSGKQFDDAFLKLNPNAKVPVIVDPDGPSGQPYTVFESGAILLYLADKTGKLLPSDPRAKFDTIQWLMTQMSTVGPMFGQYVHFIRFAPSGNDYSRSRYGTQVHRVCEVIDRRLGSSPYLGGAEYSVADIATYPWLRMLPSLPGQEAAAKLPNIARWVAEINERPAVKKALAEVDAVRARTTPFDKADAANLDRMFGRGQYAAA